MAYIGGLIFYSLSKRIYFIEVPLNVSSSHTPMVPVKIEKNSLHFLLDTGYLSFITVNKNAIPQNAKLLGKKSSFNNVFGDKFQSDTYLLKKLSIKKLYLTNVTADVTNEAFNKSTTFSNAGFNQKQEKSYQGILGVAPFFLLKKHIIFDFFNLQMILTNDITQLSSNGYFLKPICKGTFKKEFSGYCINIQTDCGNLNFAIDTGSSVSLIRSSLVTHKKLENANTSLPYCLLNEFKIFGKDFGQKKVYPKEFGKNMEKIDGILGMDFLWNYALHINHDQHTISINNSL